MRFLIPRFFGLIAIFSLLAAGCAREPGEPGARSTEGTPPSEQHVKAFHSNDQQAAPIDAPAGILHGRPAGGVALETRGQAVQSSPTTATKSVVSVTDEECRDFAEEYADAINSRDFHRASEMFDWDALQSRMFGDLKLPATFITGVRDGMESHFGEPFFEGIYKRLDLDDGFRLLRIHDDNGQKRALFRLIQDDGGFNYHDILLTKTANRSVCACDIFYVASGQSTSGTMRNMLLEIAAKRLANGNGDWDSRDVEPVAERLKAMEKVQELMEAGRARDALDFFRGLPVQTKQDKLMLFMHMGTADAAGDGDEYFRAVDTFRTTYPNDRSVDFALINYFTLKDQPDELLAVYERLNQTIGGDAYLHMEMAKIHEKSGRVDTARQAFRDAIAVESNWQSPYFSILVHCLNHDDFGETLTWLKAADRQFPGIMNDAAKLPEFEEFANAPQFEEWQHYLNQKRTVPTP